MLYREERESVECLNMTPDETRHKELAINKKHETILPVTRTICEC